MDPARSCEARRGTAEARHGPHDTARPARRGARATLGVERVVCGWRGQPLPAWLASWSRPLMMPPARSPPLNAPTMESAASFAYVSGMRLRA